MSIQVKSYIQAVMMCAALSMGALACGDDTKEDAQQTQNNSPSTKVEVQELRSTQPRAAAMEGMGVAERPAEFGFKLYKSASAKAAGKNMAVSPTSLAMALGMVGAGADKQTAQEIYEALGFESVEQMSEELNAAEQLMLQSTSDRFVYEPANQLWVAQGFEVKPSYLDSLATYYGAGVNALDMGSSPANIAKAINDWVAKKTRELIKEVVTAETFEANKPKAIWANAFYLNAKWTDAFQDYKSGDGEFTTLDGAKSPAWYMNQEKEDAQYMESDQYQALRMPFDKGQASMLVILPKEGAFEKVEQSLDAELIANIEGALEPRIVEITVPRFKFDAEFKLKASLEDMGVKQAFTNDADFSKLTDEPLSLNEGIQKINISVDEEGTVGAVVSIIWGSGATPPEDMPTKFEANRPFIFAVIHHETKQVLLLGRVLKPEFDRPQTSME